VQGEVVDARAEKSVVFVGLPLHGEAQHLTIEMKAGLKGLDVKGDVPEAAVGRTGR
jgi:hypothetical protein